MFQHVLAPIDGSENSVQAAQLAFRIARFCSAEVTALYVVDSSILAEMSRFAEAQKASLRHELHENGRQFLAYLEELARHEQLIVQTQIREGVPYEEIVSAAGELAVDVIVIGHVGRRGPRRILIGSVTERVIEFATCPVLVVKPRGSTAYSPTGA